MSRVVRKTAFSVLGAVGALLAIEAYVFLFGLTSSEERLLNENTRAYLQSGRPDVPASELLPIRWEKICILPSYTTAVHVESQLGKRFSFGDEVRWHLYWGSDDRYFGFAIAREDGSVLPLKLWKTVTAIDTDVWPARCAPRDKAIITRDHQLIALSAT